MQLNDRTADTRDALIAGPTEPSAFIFIHTLTDPSRAGSHDLPRPDRLPRAVAAEAPVIESVHNAPAAAARSSCAPSLHSPLNSTRSPRGVHIPQPSLLPSQAIAGGRVMTCNWSEAGCARAALHACALQLRAAGR